MQWFGDVMRMKEIKMTKRAIERIEKGNKFMGGHIKMKGSNSRGYAGYGSRLEATGEEAGVERSLRMEETLTEC